MAFANSPFGGMHRDVLDASPDTEEGKQKLVAEIRERAKSAMSGKLYPVADVLYTKAIEVIPDATLYANRSLAKLSTGHSAEALEDALSSCRLDPTYAKAYFRKGPMTKLPLTRGLN